MLGLVEVQRAVITLLRSSASLASAMGQATPEVYDYVPETAMFPHVVYQLSDSPEYDTTTETGFECNFEVHVWSQAEGKLESHKIMEVIYQLLHNNNTLSLTGYTLCNMRFQTSRVLRDPDGQTYHGVMQFRSVIE